MSPFHGNAPFQAKIIFKKGAIAGGREAASSMGTAAPQHEPPKPCPQAPGLWDTLLGWPHAAPRSCWLPGDDGQRCPPGGAERGQGHPTREPRCRHVAVEPRGRPRAGQLGAGSRLCRLFTPAGLDVTSHQFGVLSHIRVTHRTPRRENYRATDFPAAPGTLAAARLRRSPSPQ